MLSPVSTASRDADFGQPWRRLPDASRGTTGRRARAIPLLRGFPSEGGGGGAARARARGGELGGAAALAGGAAALPSGQRGGSGGRRGGSGGRRGGCSRRRRGGSSRRAARQVFEAAGGAAAVRGSRRRSCTGAARGGELSNPSTGYKEHSCCCQPSPVTDARPGHEFKTTWCEI